MNPNLFKACKFLILTELFKTFALVILEDIIYELWYLIFWAKPNIYFKMYIKRNNSVKNLS